MEAKKIYRGTKYKGWLDSVQVREARTLKAYRKACDAHAKVNMIDAMVQVADKFNNFTESTKLWEKRTTAAKMARDAERNFTKASESYNDLFNISLPAGLDNMGSCKGLDSLIVLACYSTGKATANMKNAGLDYFDTYLAENINSHSKWFDFHSVLAEGRRAEAKQ